MPMQFVVMHVAERDKILDGVLAFVLVMFADDAAQAFFGDRPATALPSTSSIPTGADPRADGCPIPFPGHAAPDRLQPPH
jgi:hypothetical protein